MHILPCNAAQRYRSCDTYPRISPHQSMTVWGADHAPAITVPDEGVLRPKANADIID